MTPTITSSLRQNEVYRALERDDFIPCNNDICEYPGTCYGPVGNTAACCTSGSSCYVTSVCTPYSVLSSLLASSSSITSDPAALTCNESVAPYCNTYVWASYGNLHSVTCDFELLPNSISTLTYSMNWTSYSLMANAPLSSVSLSTSTSSDPMTMALTTMMMPTQTSRGASSTPASTSNPTSNTAPTHQSLPTGAVIGIAVGATLLSVSTIIIAILLWRRRSSTTNMPPIATPSNPEIQAASYASPVSPATGPHSSWTPGAGRNEKSPSYGYGAGRGGVQPDGQVEGAGEGGSAPPAWEPPGDGVGKQGQSMGISELGGGS